MREISYILAAFIVALMFIFSACSEDSGAICGCNSIEFVLTPASVSPSDSIVFDTLAFNTTEDTSLYIRNNDSVFPIVVDTVFLQGVNNIPSAFNFDVLQPPKGIQQMTFGDTIATLDSLEIIVSFTPFDTSLVTIELPQEEEIFFKDIVVVRYRRAAAEADMHDDLCIIVEGAGRKEVAPQVPHYRRATRN